MALVSGTANAPMLPAGWTPVNHDTGHNFTDTTISEWEFNYDPSEKKWANAKDTKGNLWVWIPRFTFRKIQFADDPEVKIRFSSGVDDDNTPIDGRDCLSHTAFSFGEIDLQGFWIMKYDAYEDTANGNIPGSLPDKSSWRSISVNNIFNACLDLKNHVTTEPSGSVDTIMLRNRDWGAVAMLSCAVGEPRPTRNSSQSPDYTTGYVSNGTMDNSGETSTTGNLTGVFDMVGCANTYVASYVDNGHSNLQDNCASLVAADSKYKDVLPASSADTDQANYDESNGDFPDLFVHEITNDPTTSAGWLNWDNTATNSNFPRDSNPVFRRGGHRSGGSAGLACFSGSTGDAGSTYGFRAAFVNLNIPPSVNLVDTTFPEIRFTVSDEDGYVSKVDVFLNDVLKATYESGLEAELLYEIQYGDLNEGDNELKIIAEDDEGATGQAILNVNKAGIAAPAIGTKVIIHGKQYEITDVTTDGLVMEITLDRPLEKNIVVNARVEILEELFSPKGALTENNESPAEFGNMEHVQSLYRDGKVVEQYELQGDGSHMHTKIEATRDDAEKDPKLSRPRQIFQFKEELEQ